MSNRVEQVGVIRLGNTSMNHYKPKANARIDEVKSQCGYSHLQWGAFYQHTRNEAAKTLGKNFRSWNAVSYADKVRIQDAVYEELRKEGIPVPSEELFTWRMVNVIRNARPSG
ncbi:hypothetical protein K491DRAFT_697074 [Lophiostoma macrostomum CBS 122681]|uniref:Uncharacterized protein n=1 Tax=Lophiostoma macrostomum CBS 122681 TaxID=1314788 RepID=A0A6A6SSC0_9PLEO|nr:hypothetical protein K491DRAFT_697074 [Lophiostoma macrostomum CBS 122681]